MTTVWRTILATLLLGAAAAAADPPVRTQSLSFPDELKEVVRGDWNGDGRVDLACVCAPRAGQHGKRTFRIYFQEAGGFPQVPSRLVAVPEEAACVCAADVTGGPAEDLVLLAPDGVWAVMGLDGDAPPTVGRVFTVRTFFRHAPPKKLPRLDFARDLDGDGAADLLVPQPSGYLLALRNKEGGFGSLRALSLPGESKLVKHTNPVFETNFVSLRNTLPALLPADFDGDGRLDLFALKKPALWVFLQDGKKGFPLKPSIQARLPFLAERARGAEMDLFESKRVRVHDVNRDGRADLIYTTTHGKIGLFSSIKTAYALFLGRKDAFFPAAPDALLNIPGVAFLPEFLDYDGDGDADLLIASIRTDLFQGVQTALVKEVTVTYFLFLCQPPGLWAAQPAFREEVTFPTSMIDKGEVAPRALFRGDFDGDGNYDKVTVEEGSVLVVYRGRKEGGAYGFADKPAFRVEAETSPDLEVADLNRDGRTDILFYHEKKVVLVLSK